MKKKILGILLSISILTGLLCGCEENKTSSAEHAYTEEIQSQIASAIGKPNITNYFEYAQLKEIYELRDDPNLICYWYTMNKQTGLLTYQGKCVGYGIPYGASITANEYPDYVYSTSGIGQYKQSEPNGLYTESVVTTATWILTIDEEGNITPAYVEDSIEVFPTKRPAYLCENVPSDYDSLPDTASITGEVNTDNLDLADGQITTEEDSE